MIYWQQEMMSDTLVSVLVDVVVTARNMRQWG